MTRLYFAGDISEQIDLQKHTRLTMYYIRALIYVFLYRCLYGIVLEALSIVLETLRCVLVSM